MIVITGGSGFIGTNLCIALESLGLEYRVIDITKSRLCIGQRTDIASLCDYEEIRKLINHNDIIIHLAAAGNVIESVKSPDISFDNNVLGTFNLLKVCKEVGIRKFIFASTGGAIAGNNSGIVTEETPPSPISPYGASKASCEQFLAAFSASYNMKIHILRFANIYGPHSAHKKGLITSIMKSIINNEELLIYGDGCSSRDYLYVDDLIRLIIFTITNELDFKKLNVATSRSLSINQVLDITELILQKIIKRKYMIKRDGEITMNSLSGNLASTLYRFKPKITFENGIMQTFKWYEENMK